MKTVKRTLFADGGCFECGGGADKYNTVNSKIDDYIRTWMERQRDCEKMYPEVAEELKAIQPKHALDRNWYDFKPITLINKGIVKIPE